MEERKLFCEIDNIDSITCILGLNFPDSATEFQKATLTLAHLAASIRDNVLRGVEVPIEVVQTIVALTRIIDDTKTAQV